MAVIASVGMAEATCQACGGGIHGPSIYSLPGIVIAHLCVPCRQDYQRLLIMNYPELVASFHASSAKINRLHSGLPSPSGLSSDQELTEAMQDHNALERQMIAIWDEFVDTKQQEG